MLRTFVARNILLRETIRNTIRRNTIRTLSVECLRRRHRHSHPNLLKATSRKTILWDYETKRFYASLPPHQKIKLPALSPTMETGTIISWEKKEGDKLNEGDLLAEIETDKATMGFETPEEGYLAKILVQQGTKNVPIGQYVCIIVQNKEDIAAFKDFKDDSPPPAGAPAAPQPSAPTPAPAPAAPAPPPAAAAPAPADQGGRVYASPMAKRLAEQRQIRLQGKGTGIYDSITSRDVPAAGAAPAPGVAAAMPAAVKIPKGAPRGPAPSFVDIPLTGMRTTIAKRLTLSKQTVPHYYLTSHCNIDKLMKLRAFFNKKFEAEKIKISINDFVLKATAMASRKVPEVNAYWMDTAIRQFKNVDISVAVATDKGLLTPIIFEADNKGILEISKNLKDLATRARAGKLQPHEFEGGTISVSNLGMYDVSFFSAVINPPQAIILAVGAAQSQLVRTKVEDRDVFKDAQFITATVSCDHRVIDGAVGALWLKQFKQYIEDPETMIL